MLDKQKTLTRLAQFIVLKLIAPSFNHAGHNFDFIFKYIFLHSTNTLIIV